MAAHRTLFANLPRLLLGQPHFAAAVHAVQTKLGTGRAVAHETQRENALFQTTGTLPLSIVQVARPLSRGGA